MKTDKEKKENLLTEFPETSAAEWREAAEALLKGAPFDKVMTRATPEGIRIEPIFFKNVLEELPNSESLPGFDDYLRGTRALGYRETPWEIAQEMSYGSPEIFNKIASEDLMRGQTALNIVLDIATLKGLDPADARVGEVCGCGLSLASLKDLKTAFNGIVPSAVGIHFRSGWAGLAVGGLFFTWLDYEGINFKEVKGSLGMDPLAVQAASGQLPMSLDKLYDELTILARCCVHEAPGIRAVGVSTLPYNQAGASAVEELGIAMATGVAYLEAMLDSGLSIDEAASQIRFSFAVGGNFFMEIAKLRAARVLWSKVVKYFGGSAEAAKMVMHARTGFYNKTQKDPYVNMLRTTTEALSGVLAGVDSLCVGNFDEVSRLPSVFSNRISRNTQVILQEECELTQVVDPAGGSWAVEWLTNEVAGKAWAFFQEIETVGGMADALKNGFITERVSATAAGRTTALNERRASLVGTNVYSNADEKPLESGAEDYAALRAERSAEVKARRESLDHAAVAVIENALDQIRQADPSNLVAKIVEAFGFGATIGEVTRAIRSDDAVPAAITPLPNQRLAAGYEAMREAADAFAERTGEHPLIFLCNMGPLRRHKARAEFTKGFFESGGFRLVSPSGFETPESALEAYKHTLAGIVVVCGTDDDYAEHFEAYARVFKSAYPELELVLAGFPGANEARYREAGMDDYIFVKSDNYAVNRKFLEGLGAL